MEAEALAQESGLAFVSALVLKTVAADGFVCEILESAVAEATMHVNTVIMYNNW